MTDELRQVLAAHGLTGGTARPAGGTAGRTWRVTGPDGDWFVRRRGDRTANPARVAFDQGLRSHLAAAGFPAVAARRLPDGQPALRLASGVYEVYPWVDGLDLTPELADACRAEAAVALAEFHRLAADYPGACESLVPQFGHYQPAVAAQPRFDAPQAFLAALDQAAAQLGSPPALRQARAWVERWQAAYDPLHAACRDGVIHGDYNGCNLLFQPSGRVLGLFDYDWAWRDKPVRDVGDGMFFFGARRASATDGGSIWSLTACPELDTAAMAEFLAAYHRTRSLTPVELRAVPLALLGRWIAIRLEGVPKVPLERQLEFLLMDFAAPFEWWEAESDALASGL